MYIYLQLLLLSQLAVQLLLASIHIRRKSDYELSVCVMGWQVLEPGGEKWWDWDSCWVVWDSASANHTWFGMSMAIYCRVAFRSRNREFEAAGFNYLCVLSW